MRRGTSTATTYYLLGGLEEVHTDGTTGQTSYTKYYPSGLGLNTTRDASGSGIRYLASDGLGSVQAAFDANGTVTSSQLHGPYGSVRYTSGVMPTAKGFTGQYDDSSVNGLSYYNARSYDAALGQFTTADSVLDGLNRYGYVGGNPTTATDPTGHLADEGNRESGGEIEGMEADTSLSVGLPPVPETTPEEPPAPSSPVEVTPPPTITTELDGEEAEVTLDDETVTITYLKGSKAGTTTTMSRDDFDAQYNLGDAEGVPEPGNYVTAEATQAEQTASRGNGGDTGSDGGSGISDAGSQAGSGDSGSGEANSAPDFIGTKGGDIIPVPEGASGPEPTGTDPTAPTGIKYTGGQGGNGLAPNVSGVRIMNQTKPGRGSPGYPGGYVVYFQETRTGFEQTVHPYDGFRIRNPGGAYKDWWHIPIDLIGS